MLRYFQFLVRKQVLRLYRESLTIVREEKSLDHQKQLKDWIRYEFESRKGLTDPVSSILVEMFILLHIGRHDKISRYSQVSNCCHSA